MESLLEYGSRRGEQSLEQLENCFKPLEIQRYLHPLELSIRLNAHQYFIQPLACPFERVEEWKLRNEPGKKRPAMENQLAIQLT